tara:strand:- start:142 stop:645 length:504 start_codon:yes stop_codon:yes gene_type:complete
VKINTSILLIALLLGCDSNELDLKVVSANQLFDDIKKNNSSNVILINVWSTWCLPCIEEFPYIADLELNYNSKDLDVIFVSTDWDENSAEVKDFLLKENVFGRHYRKKEGNDQEFINQLCSSWSGVLPFTVVYDKNMALIDFWEGKRDEHFFKNKVDSLINRKGQEI